MSTFKGVEEDLPVTVRHDVYATIDPSPHYAAQTFKGKVVLVTGASRGIGQEIATLFARAGASLFLVSRNQPALEAVRTAIQVKAPDSQIECVAVDVKDPKAAKEAVDKALGTYVRLDVLVPNAATLTSWGETLAEKDEEAWWNTFEVGLRGTFNFVRPALPALQKTSGYVVAISARTAQLRVSGASDYSIMKHALNRLVEYIDLEFPDVKVFALHPGIVSTRLVNEHDFGPFDLNKWEWDTPTLCAATTVYLSAGGADWLSGRYVSANWDLGEVDRDWKAKIIAQDGLVSKCCIPK
ncbi:NAD-P-binding protein [Amylostereum chailletii]|nr:NAD-P-binding protein [Amylostereum chailletii]